MIFVGAKSAFLFIGTAEEWHTKKREVFDRLMGRKRGVLETRKMLLRREENRPDRDESKVAKLAEKVEEAVKDIAETKPLEDRAIIGKYPCDKGTVVLIEGTEEGLLWMQDEDAEPTKYAPIRENADLLAEAIILQAAADYASMVKRKTKGIERVSLERFFRSQRYGRLTRIDGELLMRMVAEDPDTVLKRKQYAGFNLG